MCDKKDFMESAKALCALGVSIGLRVEIKTSPLVEEHIDSESLYGRAISTLYNIQKKECSGEASAGMGMACGCMAAGMMQDSD